MLADFGVIELRREESEIEIEIVGFLNNAKRAIVTGTLGRRAPVTR
jgi:hypothetical protein